LPAARLPKLTLEDHDPSTIHAWIIPMSMFSPETMKLLTDDRAQWLANYSDKAIEMLGSNEAGIKHLVDLIFTDPMAAYVLESKIGDYPQAMGGLDFIAACLAEGKDIANGWIRVGECIEDEFRKDLVSYGLHGIHFRMNLKSDADRIVYTLKLAEAMFDRNSETNRIGIVPITSYSLLSGRLAHSINWYRSNGESEERGFIDFSEQELRMLCGPTNHPTLPIEDKAVFAQLVGSKIFKDVPPESRQAWQVAGKINNSLLPMVYNYGYKLKARGLPGHEVLARASSRVATLLSFLPATTEFLKALERQILINLFSAFPEDLELLNAKPEELQGVMLNPVLIKDPHAGLFRKTLAGPLALFSPRSSAPLQHRGTQMVTFFKDTPYPLHLDMALNGYLQGLQEIINLAENCLGRSQAVEQFLLDDNSRFNLHIGLIRYLGEPKQLDAYSDAAVLKLFEMLILTEDVSFSRYGAEEKMPSVAPVLSNRPHLFDSVVQILEDHGCLNPTLFEWCGFGAKELKALGKRATNELKSAHLEASMGI
jgi:hypothetical protein